MQRGNLPNIKRRMQNAERKNKITETSEAITIIES